MFERFFRIDYIKTLDSYRPLVFFPNLTFHPYSNDPIPIRTFFKPWFLSLSVYSKFINREFLGLQSFQWLSEYELELNVLI